MRGKYVCGCTGGKSPVEEGGDTLGVRSRLWAWVGKRVRGDDAWMCPCVESIEQDTYIHSVE